VSEKEADKEGKDLMNDENWESTLESDRQEFLSSV
jgi:hypothetical protein